MAVISVAGLLGFLGWRTFAGGGRDPQPAPEAAVAPDLPSAPGPVSTAVRPPPGSGAASAMDAVGAFLDAEVAGDWLASWDLLSAEDRTSFADEDAWVQDHANRPTITAVELGTPTPTATGVTVVAALALEPVLDPVIGLVPPTAEASFETVEEDGAWRVAWSSSSMEPAYPDSSAGAVEAVERWVTARQACGGGEGAGEWTYGLLASPNLADDLCGAGGAASLGRPELLPSDLAAPFLAAFGPGAPAWTWLVPVGGPVALTAAVVEVGDDWVVVGVLPP